MKIVSPYIDWRRRRKARELGPARRLLRTIARSIVAFMVLVGFVYMLIGLATSNSIFVPHGVGAVLRSARTHSAVSAWTSEQSRTVSVAGQNDRFDSEAIIVADQKRNAFQLTVIGRLPQTLSYVSDGRTVLRATDVAQQAGQPWRVLVDPCKQGQQLPASLLAPPSVDDVLAGSPQILSSAADFGGSQAWLLSFTPSAGLINRMLLTSFLDRAEPNAKAWTLPAADRQAFARGTYKVTSALAWVTRDPRLLQAVQIGLRLPDGDSLKLRATLSQPKTADPFAHYTLGKTCR